MTIKELLLTCDPELDVHALGRKTEAWELLEDLVDQPDYEVAYITAGHECLVIGVYDNEH